MNAILAKLKRIKDRVDLLTFGVTLAVSLVSGFAFVNTYVADRVDRSVSRRIEPYVIYVAANAESINGSFDTCASMLRPVLRQLARNELGEVDAAPFYDLFVACARDAPAPQAYAADIRQIEIRIANGQLPSQSWHAGALGTYYLKSGQLDRAAAYFSEAVDRFAAEGNRSEEAYANWALSVIDLIRGRVPAATAHYRRAAALMPTIYVPQPTRSSLGVILDGAKLNYVEQTGRYEEVVVSFIAAFRPGKPSRDVGLGR